MGKGRPWPFYLSSLMQLTEAHWLPYSWPDALYLVRTAHIPALRFPLESKIRTRKMYLAGGVHCKLCLGQMKLQSFWYLDRNPVSSLVG